MEEGFRPGRNGGKLLTGGKPGNRGGGTIPHRVRQACAAGFEQAIPRLVEIAVGTADGVAPNESTAAFAQLGKYGIGEIKSVQIQDAEVASLAVQLVAEIFGATPEQIKLFADRLTDGCFNLADVEDSEDED